MRSRRLPRHLLAARPWRSRTGRLLHRAMDAAADAALSRDRDPPPLPAPLPLATLTERVGKSGRPVLVGALNHCRLVVAAADELDQGGRRVWHLHLLPARAAPASTVAASPARLR
jgi:hypothetical protein